MQELSYKETDKLLEIDTTPGGYVDKCSNKVVDQLKAKGMIRTKNGVLEATPRGRNEIRILRMAERCYEQTKA